MRSIVSTTVRKVDEPWAVLLELVQCARLPARRDRALLALPVALTGVCSKEDWLEIMEKFSLTITEDAELPKEGPAAKKARLEEADDAIVALPRWFPTAKQVGRASPDTSIVVMDGAYKEKAFVYIVSAISKSVALRERGRNMAMTPAHAALLRSVGYTITAPIRAQRPLSAYETEHGEVIYGVSWPAAAPQ